MRGKQQVILSAKALGRDFLINLRIAELQDLQAMEYSVTVWRTPIRESKETLFRLTFRREWIQERNCWRDMLVAQQRESAGCRTPRF